MPNRIIKESICSSEDIDTLTAEQEVFFYRLMVVCDDYGLMDARPAILKARCYPLKSIDSKRIQLMLGVLESIGLIDLYQFEGKEYLRIVNWHKHQTIRAKKSKYPLPQADENICKQMQADDEHVQANVPVNQSNPIQSYSESNPIITPGKPAGFDPRHELLRLGVAVQTAEDWITMRRKKRASVTATAIHGICKEAEKAGITTNAALEMCCRNGWQGFSADWVAKARASPQFDAKSADRKRAVAELTGVPIESLGGKSERTEREINPAPRLTVAQA